MKLKNNKYLIRILILIFSLIIFINLAIGSRNIIEGNEVNSEKKKEQDNKNDDDDDDANSNFCMKAALLAQKNQHELEEIKKNNKYELKKIKDDYEDLFNIKMKKLEEQCKKSGDALRNSKMSNVAGYKKK